MPTAGDWWDHHEAHSLEIPASERWTDSLQDQARLEALIDTVKPPAPEGQHRLLITPFRYPPLRSGSRSAGLRCRC
ncbi:MAG: hypothetical protein ACKOCI_12125, partial [Cyanobium sp.]